MPPSLVAFAIPSFLPSQATTTTPKALCCARRFFTGTRQGPLPLIPLPRAAPPEPAPKQIVCFEDSPSDETEEEDMVMLHDESTGRFLCCGVEHALNFLEQTYLLCFPVDDVVAFARANSGHGEELETIDDPVMADKLFPIAHKVLSEENAVLQRTALMFTVEEWGELEEDDGEEEDDEEDSGNEVEVMAEFLFEGEEFLVLKLLYPTLFIAKETAEGKYVAIDGEELASVAPKFEAYIEELGNE